MRLKKAIYRCYKQHKYLEVDFTGNVIAIIGANGRGKSNVIGGLQFAFTGEQPGFNKNELTTWGEKNGSVTVVFNHDNVEWTLVRSTSSATASLTADGQTPIHGIKAVDATLRERIGIDPDIAKQAIFVNQAEIDAVLFSLPRERELAFQRLVGIGNAQRVYDALTRTMSTLATPVDYDRQIADLNLRKAQLAQIRDQAFEEEARIRLRLMQCKSPDSVRPQLDMLAHVLTAKTKYYNNQGQFMNVSQGLDRLRLQLKPEIPAVDPAELVRLQTAITQHAENIRAGEAIQNQILMHERAAAQLETAAADYDSTRQYNVSVLEARVQNLIETRNQILEDAARIQGEAQMSRQLLSTLSQVLGKQLCPLCGADVTEKANLAAQHQVIVTNADVKHKELLATAAACTRDLEREKSELAQLIRAYAATEQQLKTAEAAVKQFPKPDVDKAALGQALKLCRDSHAADSAQLSRLQTQQQLSNQTSENNRRVAMSIAAEETKLAALVTEASELLTQITGYEQVSESDVNAQIHELERSASCFTQCEREIATQLGTTQTITAQLVQVEEDLATLMAKREAQSAYVKATDVLTRVKQWFHYENGPHAVTAAVLKELTPNVNFFLSKLSAPFVVTPDLAAVGFRYQMTDGTQMPDELPNAKALSGAQKNMLAMAFRLASYCMFAAKLGVLVLDEPTAHLDQDNVGKFGELLSRIQQIAVDMDLQILIVTHHAEILPFCDATISLGK